MSIVPLLSLAALAGAVWFGVRAARKTPLPPASESGSADAEKLRPLKTMTHIAYGLYAAALLFPVTAIAALILGYIKRGEAHGTWLESHFAWQIRTFWFMLLWVVVGMAAFFILIGWLVLVVAGIWFIYRVVFGWVSLNDGRPMPMKGGATTETTIGQQG
jgi:uncharacterized membrane protein